MTRREAGRLVAMSALWTVTAGHVARARERGDDGDEDEDGDEGLEGEKREHERNELAEAVGASAVTLERALDAAAAGGTPLAARFEDERGRVRISVFTAKAGKLSETLVDRKTGKVGASAPIDDDDRDDATAAQAALAGAKLSLADAVRSALSSNKGWRAVSAIPTSKGGKPAVAIWIVQGKTWKMVSAPLVPGA